MFERFTNRARHVVVLAQEEARRLQHNYIGTEHLLLGLLGEEGIASEALERFGVSLASVREDVEATIGLGTGPVSGHIPFTPRAKKTLELALREALQLHHNFIGTEHILLGVLREGRGVGAQILQQYAIDLMTVRMAVLDLVATTPVETTSGNRGWFRRRSAPALGMPAEARAAGGPAGRAELNTTPAADKSLSEAARLAGSRPVGSHHLLLAAIGDLNSAAARALTAHGLDLEQVRAAVQAADITGTSDEQPAEAGRRQLRIRVSDDQLTVEVTDPVLVGLGRAAVVALGDTADPAGTIPGDLPASGSLSTVWQTLHDSLADIRRQAAARQPSKATNLGSSGGGLFSKGSGSEDSGTESSGSHGSGPDDPGAAETAAS
jgi:ATP-dependent Clp protease ATP-binding subunit ClpA